MNTIDRWRMCLLLALILDRSKTNALRADPFLLYDQLVHQNNYDQNTYDEESNEQSATNNLLGYFYQKLPKHFHSGDMEEERLKVSHNRGRSHAENKRSSWSTCTRRELCYCYSRVSNRYFCCDCDNGACFPATSMVHVKHKGFVTIDELRIDDQVITVSDLGVPTYSKVLAFLDRRTEGEAAYVSLKTSTNQTLHLSRSHLVFITRPNSTLQNLAILAEEVRIGDIVTVVTSSQEGDQKVFQSSIVDIDSKIMQGAYVPVTSEGSIVVDGVLASCYTSFDHHVVHKVFAPLRWLPRLFETESSQHANGIRTYAKFLKFVGSTIYRRNSATTNYFNDVTVVQRPTTSSTALCDALNTLLLGVIQVQVSLCVV